MPRFARRLPAPPSVRTSSTPCPPRLRPPPRRSARTARSRPLPGLSPGRRGYTEFALATLQPPEQEAKRRRVTEDEAGQGGGDNRETYSTSFVYRGLQNTSPPHGPGAAPQQAAAPPAAQRQQPASSSASAPGPPPETGGPDALLHSTAVSASLFNRQLPNWMQQALARTRAGLMTALHDTAVRKLRRQKLPGGGGGGAHASSSQRFDSEPRPTITKFELFESLQKVILVRGAASSGTDSETDAHGRRRLQESVVGVDQLRFESILARWNSDLSIDQLELIWQV